MKWTIFAAVPILILTSWLYIHGYMFWYGYLKYFNIPGEMFPLSFEETLLQGFAHNAPVVWSPSLSVCLLSLTGLALLSIFDSVLMTPKVYMWISLKKLNQPLSRRDEWLPFGPEYQGLSASRIILRNLAWVTGIFALLLAITLLTAAGVQKQGRNYALKEYQKLAEGESEHLIELVGSPVIAGTIFLGNAEIIAIYRKGESILLLPMSQVRGITTSLQQGR